MNVPVPNNLEAFWMPFTANRQFKKAPRLLASASGMYYTTVDGRKLLGAAAGLWCVNAGHGRREIVEAVASQRLASSTAAPAFQMGHPKAFELAARLTSMMPKPLDHVFFTNSGSESVETALKIALALSAGARQGTKTRLIGRERGYHGIPAASRSAAFPPTASSSARCSPASTTCATPMTSSAMPIRAASRNTAPSSPRSSSASSTCTTPRTSPPSSSSRCRARRACWCRPRSYLERLLQGSAPTSIAVFDEVITGFGRLGTPFAVDYFGVVPDMVATAKGITNGVIPMGGVFCSSEIYDAFMTGPEHAIELFHGYTLGPSGGLRRLDGDARHLCERGAPQSRPRARSILRGRAALAEGPAARHRHPQVLN